MKKQICFFVALFWCGFIISSATNLAYLIEKNKTKEIKELINDPSVNLKYQDSNGNSLLMIAIDNKWLDIAQSLIDKRIDIDAKNIQGDTALSHAVLDGHVEVVKKLIEAGVNVQAENNVGRKAVTLASILSRDERINLDQKKKQKYQEIYNLLKEPSCFCVIA